MRSVSISGAHLNPAISLGLVVGKRFPASDLIPYIVAQVVGAIAAAGVLYVIASGKEGFSLAGGFASNGYAEHSPGGYSLTACLVTEIVLTFVFLLVVMGADGSPGIFGIRGDCHWVVLDGDPSGGNSSDESFSESGAQHGTGNLRGRLGGEAVVALLGGAIDWRSAGRRGLSSDTRRIGWSAGRPGCRNKFRNADLKNREPPRIFPERLFWFRSLALLMQLLRERRMATRDQ